MIGMEGFREMGAWVSSWITVVFSFGFCFSALVGRARAGRLEAKKRKKKIVRDVRGSYR